jgi:hypothetical protein
MLHIMHDSIQQSRNAAHAIKKNTFVMTKGRERERGLEILLLAPHLQIADGQDMRNLSRDA